MKKTPLSLFFLYFLGLTSLAFSQKTTLSTQAKISVLTCGTGNESYSLFGHTAIRVQDSINQIDLVYNYGAFDFSTPNFIAKFSKGDLQYFAITHSFTDFINEYVYEKRFVYQQDLKISSQKKQQLFDNLNAVLDSDQKFYTYKFIDKNCTSMVVDIINNSLGEKVIYKKLINDASYRDILFPYFNGSFYYQLGTSIIFGSKVDAVANKLFLPLELHENLKQIRYKNKLLCPESIALLDHKTLPKKSWWNSIYSLVLVLGFIIIVNKKQLTILYFSILGILGLFFAFMGFYSLHGELAYNYNILLFNPSLLVLAIFWMLKNIKIVRILVLTNIAFLVIYMLWMTTKIHLWIVSPFIIANFIALFMVWKNTVNEVEVLEKK